MTFIHYNDSGLAEVKVKGIVQCYISLIRVTAATSNINNKMISYFLEGLKTYNSVCLGFLGTILSEPSFWALKSSHCLPFWDHSLNTE